MRIFSGIDRRIGGAFLLAIVLIGSTYLFFTRSASSQLSAAEARLTQANENVDSLKRRVAEIQRDGTSSLETLISRLTALETALPLVSDDLGITAAVAESAVNKGVKLVSFDPSPDKTVATGGLGYVTYSFNVSGTPDATFSWLQDTLRTSSQVITMQSSSVRNLEGGGKESSAFAGIIEITGTIRVWYSTTPPITKNATTPGQNAPGQNAQGQGTPTAPGQTTPSKP